jgi:UDP-N-acetylglucosamine--N-acetylmuramyl-(pentapeptide) pyrophosphoryl-undecaprenol N-acetylglucosamine transferase
MIMAGGTGGHVFPGLTVADALRRGRHAVVWLGTHNGLEARVVPRAGLEMEWVSISGLRGHGWIDWLLAPWRVAGAVAQALLVMRRRRPSAVLGMGGFVSGPGGVAAWLCRRPLLIHEQNAVAGVTNRLLARFADRVFEAFPGSFPAAARAQLIGNPVRRAIASLAPPRERFEARRGERPRLLVLGGSQGARTLNRVLPEALARLPEALRPSIWHQAGAGAEEARALYARHDLAPRLEAFIEDMAAAYGWADLVVARAGALTLAELAAAGVGAILVPYPHAVDDHQTRNAQSFVAEGAGILIPEKELQAGALAQRLAQLLGDREKLLGLAEHARRQARISAAEALAGACVQLSEARS